MTTEKYEPQAERWTEDAYADSARYLAHRADLIVSLGPRLGPGDRVVDLACGDAGLGERLLERGLDYTGVDLSEAMVEAARRRLGGRAEIVVGDLNEYAPPEPVAGATIFRAVYYARDRLDLFRRIEGYVTKKLVFDLNPRQYRLDDVRADLRRVGFDRLDLRPFFVPQTKALPRPLARALEWAELTGPLARLALRLRFTYICAASRGERSSL